MLIDEARETVALIEQRALWAVFGIAAISVIAAMNNGQTESIQSMDARARGAPERYDRAHGTAPVTPPVQPRTVRVDVQRESCQSYGKSVADATTTALKQSDKFDYAYLGMFVDTRVVVTERDGSVYVDLLTGGWYAAHKSERSDVSQIERRA